MSKLANIGRVWIVAIDTIFVWLFLAPMLDAADDLSVGAAFVVIGILSTITYYAFKPLFSSKGKL